MWHLYALGIRGFEMTNLSRMIRQVIADRHAHADSFGCQGAKGVLRQIVDYMVLLARVKADPVAFLRKLACPDCESWAKQPELPTRERVTVYFGGRSKAPSKGGTAALLQWVWNIAKREALERVSPRPE